MARLKPGDIVFLHESQEVADTLERWIEAIAPLAGHPFAAGLSDGVHVSKDELANPESRKKINVAERVVLAMSSEHVPSIARSTPSFIICVWTPAFVRLASD